MMDFIMICHNKRMELKHLILVFLMAKNKYLKIQMI